MKILNLGKKSPVMVFLGEFVGKTFEGTSAAFIGSKTSDTHPPQMATWVKFDTAKEMEAFITRTNLKWV